MTLEKRKSILILGGTNFIGRNLVDKLLDLNEYEITLFNRQQTQSDLFPSIKKIKGDRETDDVNQIEGKNWNYVIDLSCYYPKTLERVLNSINKVEKYVFISTCSVYDNENKQSLLKNEEAEILSCSAEQKIDRNPESYGNRKAECERFLRDSGLPYVILRPALVFGKYDPTDRLYYWLYQVKKKNELLLPENGERLFSTTNVADLVEIIIRSLKPDNKTGVYNVITNPKTSIKQIVDIAKENLNSEFSVVNATADFLTQNDVKQWLDMPLWINGDHFTYGNQKMREEYGTVPTEFDESLKNTIDYYHNINWPKPAYGISEERKKELLDLLLK